MLRAAETAGYGWRGEAVGGASEQPTFCRKFPADPGLDHGRTDEYQIGGNQKLPGASLQKFVGCDTVVARALQQNSCSFKLAGRLTFAANDAPDIARPIESGHFGVNR